MLKRPNEEIRRRIGVARIFPSLDSWLRLVRALAVEIRAGVVSLDVV
jgi:transposase-like protein